MIWVKKLAGRNPTSPSLRMAMPLLMTVSEGCYLWTKKPIYLELSKRWAAGTEIYAICRRTGFAMLAVAAWVVWSWWRTRRLPDNKWLLRALVCCSPFGFIAVETGWFVTELGRQPWIIYGFMRTKEAVTPMPGLVVPFTTFTIVYLLLAVIVIFLLRRQFIETQPRWIKRETLKKEPVRHA